MVIPSDALRHRAEVTLAAVARARGQFGAAEVEIKAGGDDTVGAWCDVLHALDAAAELAHAVVRSIAPPRAIRPDGETRFGIALPNSPPASRRGLFALCRSGA